MTDEQTLPYAGIELVKFRISDMISAYFDRALSKYLVGTLGVWNALYQAVSTIESVIELGQWGNVIANSDGYAIMMTVEDASGTESSSAVMIWSNYPACVVPDGSTDVVVVRW